MVDYQDGREAMGDPAYDRQAYDRLGNGHGVSGQGVHGYDAYGHGVLVDDRQGGTLYSSPSVRNKGHIEVNQQSSPRHANKIRSSEAEVEAISPTVVKSGRCTCGRKLIEREL